jgi:hypothetical protein
MMAEIESGKIRFACAGGMTLSYGEEFSVLDKPDPSVSPSSVSIIPRRLAATLENTVTICIETGMPMSGEYVVVKFQEGDGGVAYLEAVPAHSLDAGVRSVERDLTDRLAGELDELQPPVRVVENRVRLDPERMTPNRAYRVSFRGRRRVFIRNTAGEIEVYRG